MELSIRTQDREALLNLKDNLIIKEVENRNYKYGDIDKTNEFAIVSNDIILGYYETKERALQVLDKIQDMLKLKDLYKYDKELILKGWENLDGEQIKMVRQQMSVYEMPEE